jgi:hypothetical protein
LKPETISIKGPELMPSLEVDILSPREDHDVLKISKLDEVDEVPTKLVERHVFVTSPRA